MLKADLEKQLKDILVGIGIQDIEPVIERPADITHGDYSTNVALVAFGKYLVSGIKYKEYSMPFELACAIAEILNTKYLILHALGRAEAVQPGFINFWISKEDLLKGIEPVSYTHLYVVISRN